MREKGWPSFSRGFVPCKDGITTLRQKHRVRKLNGIVVAKSESYYQVITIRRNAYNYALKFQVLYTIKSGYKLDSSPIFKNANRNDPNNYRLIF